MDREQFRKIQTRRSFFQECAGGVGVMALFAGLGTLVDGNMRVNDWNDSCSGSTAAERYCLFEPLPTSHGEAP